MSSIRALAADLMARSDDDLRELFAARPDLIDPPVPDFSALAARAATRVSVQRALENLTTPQTRLLEAVHLLTDEDAGQSTSAARLRGAIADVPQRTLSSLLDTLHQLALLYVADPPPAAGNARGRFYLPVSSLKDVIGPYRLGLGREYRTLAAQHPGFGLRVTELVEELRSCGYPLDPAGTILEAAASLRRWICEPAHWQTLMKQAPEGTFELLEKFRSAAVGRVPAAARQVSVLTEPAEVKPVQWLLARGLLVPLDAEHVELPRSAGQAARGHVLIDQLQLVPPAAELARTSAARRDNAAFGSVAEILRLLSDLVSDLNGRPLATLRSGGIGVREVRKVSERLRIDEQQSTMILEFAAMAGLIRLDPDSSQWLAAEGAGQWMLQPRPDQWRVLLQGWLDSTRAPSLVGEPLPSGAAINALAAEAARPDAPLVRHRALQVLVELSAEADGGGSGGGSDDTNDRPAALDTSSVITRLSWHQPRLQRRFRRLVPGILRETELLGLTGSGALTGVGRATAAGQLGEAAQLLGESLPQPLNHVLLQADLTAVAPGYLDPALTRELNLLADAEGQGPATTYRFSSASIRRALDAGRDGGTILRFLQEHSPTDVPQPLTYLVEDTASRHGTLRIGPAGSYLRSEDETALAVLLSDDRAAALGLRQLAPTVVVSRASAREIAAVLQDLGLNPLLEVDDGGPESAGGGAAPGRTTGHRDAAGTVPGRESGAWQHRSRRAAPSADEGASASEVSDQLARLRSAGSMSAGRSGPSGESGPLISMETLHKAIRLKKPVRISTVDSLGNQQTENLVPVSVTGGRVRAFDPRQEVERVFSIHRVMDVELLEEPEAQ